MFHRRRGFRVVLPLEKKAVLGVLHAPAFDTAKTQFRT
jgi:hypothetical protein